jgi:sugar phosphate isomerase/epimerase
MALQHSLSRRSVLSCVAAAPLALAFRKKKSVPVGLELYSVRDDLKTDLSGTLDAVAKMGYECVEFFSPYYEWSLDKAKEVRKQLDGLGMRCYSTHNSKTSFSPEGISKAIDLNKALGSRYIVLAHPGKVANLDGWKQVADLLNQGNDRMKSSGLHAGYHNHADEWKAIDGQQPMVVLANNTDKTVMLQLDVGTCIETGNDPVAWIESHPGRIRSLHLKEWSPQKGYRVLTGEGVAPWKKIFAAAESKGGVEFYLIEQEGSDYTEKEGAARCLVTFKELHGTT